MHTKFTPEIFKATFVILASTALALYYQPVTNNLEFGVLIGIFMAIMNFFDNEYWASPKPKGHNNPY